MDTASEERVTATSKHRLQFDFSSDAYERIQDMKNETNTRSYSEVVRNALRLYEWFLAQKRDGKTILVQEGDRIKQVEFFF